MNSDNFFLCVAVFGYRDTGMDLTPYLYPEIKLFTFKTLTQIQYNKFSFGCVCLALYDFFFSLDFGLSQLTSLQFIQYHVAGFCKPTIPQSPPSNLRDYSTCNNARLEFSPFFVPSFDPNEWCLKNSLHSGGLNPGPLGHESSAYVTMKYVQNNWLIT
jgi:hypothetical protein